MTVPQYLEDIILAENRRTAEARAVANAKYSQGNWSTVADLLSQWGDHAPTLPAGALVAFAHAGIGPTSPFGQQVISRAVPATTPPEPRDPVNFPFGHPPTGETSTAHTGAAIGDPNALLVTAPEHHGGGGILGKITGAAGAVGGFVGRDVIAPVNRDVVQPVNRALEQGGSKATGGAISPEQVQAGVAPTDVKSATRTAFNAMQAPLQVIQAGERFSQSPIAPLPPQIGPFKSKGVVTGSVSQMLDPRQITLYNQLKGESTGAGYFPAGQAAQTQAEAARSAATIYGGGQAHGFTFGRGLANAVTTPGTVPYGIISGSVDATIALKGDPTAALMNELSTEHALARTFTATPEEAYTSVAQHLVDNVNTSEQVTKLREWTNISRETQPDLRLAVIDKLKGDPGALSQLTKGPEAITSDRAALKAIGTNTLGASTFLRRHVDQPTALKWLNSKAGRDFAQHIADDPSIYNLYKLTNGQVPVGLLSAMARTNDPEYVKFLLNSEIGTTLTKTPGFSWQRPLEDVRMLHGLPEAADITDRQQMFEQASRHLIAANVPRDQWDAVLHPIADAVDAGEMKQAYVDGLTRVISKNLTERYHISEGKAEKLTRFFWDQTDEQSKYAVDQLGNTPHLPGVMIDGEMVPIVGPHQTNELLNRAVPALDARELARATAAHQRVINFYESPVAKGFYGFGHALDYITTNVFKPAVLLAPRVMTRFLLDEQASMAADGMDSWLSHPIKMLGWTIGAKHELPGMARFGTTDLTGEDWMNQIDNWRNDFSKALGRGRTTFGSPTSATTSRMLLKNMTQYGKNEAEYTRAWSEELSSLAANPVSREVARAIQDPEHLIEGTDSVGVQAVKDAFWDGSLSAERQKLINAKTDWGSQYMDPSVERGVDTSSARAFSDAYIDSEVNRVLTKTAGDPTKVADPDLLDAVATGRAFRAPGKVDASFTRSLADKKDEFGPIKVKGRLAINKTRADGMNRFVHFMFSKLMDTPTTTLTRSPAFRQEYYRKAQDMMPFLDSEGQATFLRFARENGIELNPVTTIGDLAAEDADLILKAHALEHVRKILYYPGERVGLTDKMRNITPFADAWRRVIARWSTLATEHPQIIRRFQQGVTGARESGWFHPDPAQGGKEVFTIIPRGVMQHLAGVPFPIVAPVSGLNLVGQGLPGVGPAVTLGVGPLMANMHGTAVENVRNFLFPYGLPDTGGGKLEDAFFPGWADKFRTAGVLAHIPYLAEAPSQREQMTLANLAKDILSYKVSAGTVDMHDVDSLQAGWKSSMSEAKKMYTIMGLAQFVAPAAPTLERNVKLKDGSIVERYVLTEDYKKILDSQQGDYYKANDLFIRKYGPQYIFAVEPKAQTLVFGIGSGPIAQAFKSAHGAFAQKFPDVYGYWAPTVAKTQRGSYQDYLDSIAQGNIAPLSVEDWTRLAEARVGNVAYDQARQMIGPSPNAEQRQWLSNVKEQLRQRFPGFDVPVGQQRLTGDQKIRQITEAVNNKDVPDSPVNGAIKAYLAARNQALAAAKERGLTGTSLQSSRMDDWKQWLFNAGTTIAKKTPEFTNIWNDVFQYEVDPNG